MLVNTLLALLFFGILDALWLSWASPKIYLPMLSKVQKEPVIIRHWPAFWSYIIIALSISLIILPASNEQLNSALYYSALTGFLVYSIYNLVNYSVFKDWGIYASIHDTLWGTLVLPTATFLVIQSKKIIFGF
jgi:uncharacterized membrane protein